jgi:peroxiredoxin
MLLYMMRTPDYTGPAVGQKMPAFTTALASGSAFTNADLANGQRTVLVFFRGHW